MAGPPATGGGTASGRGGRLPSSSGTASSPVAVASYMPAAGLKTAIRTWDIALAELRAYAAYVEHSPRVVVSRLMSPLPRTSAPGIVPAPPAFSQQRGQAGEAPPGPRKRLGARIHRGRGRGLDKRLAAGSADAPGWPRR